MRPDVLVVGAGAIGCAVSESLATEGLRVRLLERGAVGDEASGAAAGMLAPVSEADGDGPLLRLGLESLSRFAPLCERLKDETGIDPELEGSGVLHVARDDAERVRLAERFARLPADLPAGAAPSWLRRRDVPQGVVENAPLLSGAFSTSFAFHVRPPRFVEALAASARRLGVEVARGVSVLGLRRHGERVVGVETDAGPIEAAAVVVAAGPWTPALVASVAPRTVAAGGVAIEPVRGQILSLAPPLPRTREIVWSEGLYLVPKRDGRWIVGATEERVGFDRRVTAEGVATLIARLHHVLPGLADATFERAWAGLRPVSADGVPWIGRVAEAPGLFVAAGHGRNGILLAPLTAERVRDGILRKRTESADDPCRIGRVFDGRSDAPSPPAR